VYGGVSRLQNTIAIPVITLLVWAKRVAARTKGMHMILFNLNIGLLPFNLFYKLLAYSFIIFSYFSYCLGYRTSISYYIVITIVFHPFNY
jgi:hypothetical protein